MNIGDAAQITDHKGFKGTIVALDETADMSTFPQSGAYYRYWDAELVLDDGRHIGVKLHELEPRDDR